MMRTAILTLLISFSFALQASEPLLTFRNDVNEARYQHLIEELRCPKCQNQNLADSNAPIAMDLRNQVYQMLEEQNASDKEIIDYMVARYGEFVLYRPQNNAGTFFLWYGPFLFLLVGGIAFALVIWRNSQSKGGK